MKKHLLAIVFTAVVAGTLLAQAPPVRLVDVAAEAGLDVVRWSSYLLPDAMGAFDLSHYYGAPTLVTKRFTGRWILWPGKWRYLPWERALESQLVRWCSQVGIDGGAYFFFVARKGPNGE